MNSKGWRRDLLNLNKVREKMKKLNIEGVLITNSTNRRYLTRFTGSAGFVLVTLDDAYFLTDFRYAEQAQEQVKHFQIAVYKSSRDAMTNLLKHIKKIGIKRLGFEAEGVSYNFYTQLKELDTVELIPVQKLIEKIRLVKTEDEVEKIRRAAEISDAAFLHIQNFIQPGISEKEVAHELDYFMKKNGGEGEAFPYIVASGNRGALPHGVASEKIIEKGEFITLDYGTMYQGYNSDMTRTIGIAEPNQKLLDIYDVVLEALEKTLREIKIGMKGKEVDKIAQNYISSHGYGDFFGHGLGHGLGLNVHEDPFFSDNNEEILQEGMVVTIEPGIYLPGIGGVRIEDDILLKADGIEILTKSTKKLILL